MDEAKCAYAGKTINQVHHSLQPAWLEGSWWSIPCMSCVSWGGGRSQEPSLLTMAAWVLHFLHRARVSVGVGSTVFSGQRGELFRIPLGLCVCVCTRIHVWVNMGWWGWYQQTVLGDVCFSLVQSFPNLCQVKESLRSSCWDFRNKFPVSLWRVASSHMVLELRLVSSFQPLVWDTSASYAAPRTRPYPVQEGHCSRGLRDSLDG